jgi:hypothetical protein
MASHESRNMSMEGFACEPCERDMHGPFGAVVSVTNRLPMNGRARSDARKSRDGRRQKGGMRQHSKPNRVRAYFLS